MLLILKKIIIFLWWISAKWEAQYTIHILDLRSSLHHFASALHRFMSQPHYHDWECYDSDIDKTETERCPWLTEPWNTREGQQRGVSGLLALKTSNHHAHSLSLVPSSSLCQFYVFPDQKEGSRGREMRERGREREREREKAWKTLSGTKWRRESLRGRLTSFWHSGDGSKMTAAAKIFQEFNSHRSNWCAICRVTLIFHSAKDPFHGTWWLGIFL